MPRWASRDLLPLPSFDSKDIRGRGVHNLIPNTGRSYKAKGRARRKRAVLAAAEELLRDPRAITAGAKREAWMDHAVESRSIERWRTFLHTWHIDKISVWLFGFDALGVL